MAGHSRNLYAALLQVFAIPGEVHRCDLSRLWIGQPRCSSFGSGRAGSRRPPQFTDGPKGVHCALPEVLLVIPQVYDPTQSLNFFGVRWATEVLTSGRENVILATHIYWAHTDSTAPGRLWQARLPDLTADERSKLLRPDGLWPSGVAGGAR